MCKAATFKMSALSPTTPEAWQYFFVKIHEGMNYKAFAQDWDHSANGKDCFYVITEVLSPWEKVTNICTSQEMIQDKIDLIEQSHQIIVVSGQQFPTFLTENVSAIQPPGPS